MVHIKDPLLLIENSSQCSSSSEFSLSLSEGSLTICLMLYGHKIKCVECIINEHISVLLHSWFYVYFLVFHLWNVNTPLLKHRYLTSVFIMNFSTHVTIRYLQHTFYIINLLYCLLLQNFRIRIYCFLCCYTLWKFIYLFIYLFIPTDS